jgi:hypothetical protein
VRPPDRRRQATAARAAAVEDALDARGWRWSHRLSARLDALLVIEESGA